MDKYKSTVNVTLETQEHEVEAQLSQKREELKKIINSSIYSRIDNRITKFLNEIHQKSKYIETVDNLCEKMQRWAKEISKLTEEEETEFTVRKIKIILTATIINLYLYICIKKLKKLTSRDLTIDPNTSVKVSGA